MIEIIPFDQREGFIWYNGEIVPWQSAKMHVLSHGLHYASCVFEGIRAYNGQIFMLKAHNQRLHKSAEFLDFKIPFTTEQLDQATIDIVKKQNVNNGYIRSFAWRGSERMAVSSPNSSIHVAIACWEMPTYYKENKKGIRLDIADWVRPAPNSAPTESKAAGLYMISTLSKHKAERAGYNDALMLDYRGYIAEATVANFFMVINGELHTPIADCFLNGITRQNVIRLARDRGIKVVERHILPEELKDASECFVTGTAAEITPVIEIKGEHYNVGELTLALMEDYRLLVESAIK